MDPVSYGPVGASPSSAASIFHLNKMNLKFCGVEKRTLSPSQLPLLRGCVTCSGHDSHYLWECGSFLPVIKVTGKRYARVTVHPSSRRTSSRKQVGPDTALHPPLLIPARQHASLPHTGWKGKPGIIHLIGGIFHHPLLNEIRCAQSKG